MDFSVDVKQQELIDLAKTIAEKRNCAACSSD